jgi:D-alanyl-D-alanine-carboxypeptidase/D-alanyl-D-alanine-endopeptidase
VSADIYATRLVKEVRARPWGLAVVAIDGDSVAVEIDRGDDDIDASTLFEIGSITKTVTGHLLAESVLRDEVSLDTTVGEVIGDAAGNAAGVSMRQLATHRSGLPRLPPNLDPEEIDPSNPYAAFTVGDLHDALAAVDLGADTFVYSNFGFMLLGSLLSRVSGLPYSELADSRVFRPMNLAHARVDAPPSPLRCYSGSAEATWWDHPLPGAGGVAMSIDDLSRYLAANLNQPPSRDGESATSLATTVHAGPPDATGLGWMHEGGGWWHNGGTGGFRSFCAFHRSSRTAVGLLANSSKADVVDAVGFSTLTEMIKSKENATRT